VGRRYGDGNRHALQGQERIRACHAYGAASGRQASSRTPPRRQSGVKPPHSKRGRPAYVRHGGLRRGRRQAGVVEDSALKAKRRQAAALQRGQARLRPPRRASARQGRQPRDLLHPNRPDPRLGPPSPHPGTDCSPHRRKEISGRAMWRWESPCIAGPRADSCLLCLRHGKRQAGVVEDSALKAKRRQAAALQTGRARPRLPRRATAWQAAGRRRRGLRAKGKAASSRRTPNGAGMTFDTF